MNDYNPDQIKECMRAYHQVLNYAEPGRLESECHNQGFLETLIKKAETVPPELRDIKFKRSLSFLQELHQDKN